VTAFEAATQARRRESLSRQQRLPWGPVQTPPKRAPGRTAPPPVPRGNAPTPE